MTSLFLLVLAARDPGSSTMAIVSTLGRNDLVHRASSASVSPGGPGGGPSLSVNVPTKLSVPDIGATFDRLSAYSGFLMPTYESYLIQTVVEADDVRLQIFLLTS